MDTKDIKYKNVIDTTLRLLGIYGIDRLTISFIAQNCGVSRGWIYKYIGKNSDEVVLFAVKVFGEQFSRLTDLTISTSPAQAYESIFSYTKTMVQQIEQKPLILRVYFGQHEAENVVGETIRHIESQYIEILMKTMKSCYNLPNSVAQTRALMIHFMRMGAVHSYFFRHRHFTDDSWKEIFWQEFSQKLKAILNA